MPPKASTTIGFDEFTTFMRAYQDMVYSTAVRLTGDEAEAEDIAQEVFLRAHRHFDELQHSVTIGGWLKTVATNLALNHLSRYRKRWQLFSQMHVNSDDDAPPIDVEIAETATVELEAEQRQRCVEQALRALPDHQRVPLVLFHFEEIPYEEIARKLQVSLPKLKTDIFRARSALMKTLTRQGVTSVTQDL